MKLYDKFIYKAKKATIEELTGKDLRITLNDTKEIASGLDQWKPAELKMLSNGALDQLARMLNLIEEGADWPTEMNASRAGFCPKMRTTRFAPRTSEYS